MKIMLVCSAGMSTSLLVNQMLQYCEEGDIVEAFSYSRLQDKIDDYDVILVGPQIRFMYDEIEKLAIEKGKKVTLIPIQIYGNRDGKGAISLVQKLYNE